MESQGNPPGTQGQEGEAPGADRKQDKEEWAIKVDVDAPVDDFYKRVPDMAYKVGGV